MGSPTKWPKTDPLHRLLTRRLDAMVAISDYIRKNCFRLYRISEGKVRLLYYGLGSEVVGQPEKGREIREKLGVQPEELLVGMVAQISRDKRQDLLLQAAGRVLAEFPETKFVFAGAPTNQEYEDKLRATAEQSGLAGRVLFTGFWEDIPSLMQALDIAVLPSRGEAFGLVMIEAMANGRVFVGSRSGAIPEVVEHGRNGLLFEPGDPEDLARALIELLRDPTKRSRMGTEARKTFEERFTLDREIQETEELYRSLIR
jgi:glycosyltransferase involved in cell wall biosynthesis